MQEIKMAQQELQRRICIQRTLHPKSLMGNQRLSAYIVEGCYCLGQGGVAQRYHVHLFLQKRFHEWVRDRPTITVVEEVEL